jgi:hypothetical protein
MDSVVFSRQFRPIACQIPQFLYWSLGHETALQQPVSQQIADPFAVFLVRLLSGNVPHVVRVSQKQREVTLEHIPHRFPVNTGGFHSDLLDFRGIEPELQLLKIAPVSSEFLLTHLALLTGLIHQQAGSDEVLMYVNAATAAVNYFHNSSFAAERGTKNKKQYPSRALCLEGTGSTALFHDTSRARFMNGLSGTRLGRPSVAGVYLQNASITFSSRACARIA